MKNKAIISALLLVGMVSPGRRTSCNSKLVAGIDALQFRAPYSLGELLHDGLVAVEEKVQEVLENNDLVISSLESSATILDDLHNQYQGMVDKSNMHTMQRDDRDFLQSMIDRIDHMIQTLEGSRSYTEAELSVIQKNFGSLSELKLLLGS